jgi:excisionase family DNA binding protein
MTPAAVITYPRISYSLDGACKAVGLGPDTLRRAIADGELVAHYLGTKPVIRAVDLDTWIESLPTERRSSA